MVRRFKSEVQHLNKSASLACGDRRAWTLALPLYQKGLHPLGGSVSTPLIRSGFGQVLHFNVELAQLIQSLYQELEFQTLYG